MNEQDTGNPGLPAVSTRYLGLGRGLEWMTPKLCVLDTNITNLISWFGQQLILTPFLIAESPPKRGFNLYATDGRFRAASYKAQQPRPRSRTGTPGPGALVYSNVLLAYMSRRLIGELIGYSWSGVRPSSVVVVVHNAQRSSPKPLGQSKSKFMWSLLG